MSEIPRRKRLLILSTNRLLISCARAPIYLRKLARLGGRKEDSLSKKIGMTEAYFSSSCATKKTYVEEGHWIETNVMDGLNGILGTRDEAEWDFIASKGSPQRQIYGDAERKMDRSCVKVEDAGIATKGENVGFWDAKNGISLNLSLNYQEIIDAWSENCYVFHDNLAGEEPQVEEESERRRARLLKYREKRQSRLFCKKIRYQVRKLNAEKRPRLKGRFVKRSPEGMM